MPTQRQLDETQQLVSQVLTNNNASLEESSAVLSKAVEFGISPAQIAAMTGGLITEVQAREAVARDFADTGASFLAFGEGEEAALTPSVEGPGIPEPVTTTPTTLTTGVNVPTTPPTTTPTPAGETDVAIPSTASPEEAARQEQIRLGQIQVASGDVAVPGADLIAQPTSLAGTVTADADVRELAQPSTVVTPAPVIAQDLAARQAQASTTEAPLDVTASLIENVADVGALDPTLAAEGQLDPQAVAEQVDATLSAGAEAQAAQVEDIPPGATVEAVVGTIAPEDLAQAAKVAGLEASRIDSAKEQLRRAGLSEADIIAFGNDPSALELRLTDFTEEQRGIIGGLPIEALVSTQMEQLLAGIESGEMPLWARPATAAVEQLLTRRGLTASSIGRDALVNAIIQSALPIAAQNAQNIKESVLQKRGLEQQALVAEAQFRQEATLQNAQNSFNLNIRNLNAEQQAGLANSQFMQTVTLTNTNNRQQVAIQNAVNWANLDVQALDTNGRLRAQNAQAFLQMDLSNLSNDQQALILDRQFDQQTMLTNTAAANAAAQFNSASENQTNQFMASLSANVSQFNATQLNAMGQFNVSEANRLAAVNANNTLQAQLFNTQMMVQVDQFNSSQQLATEQWNTANAQAIEQSNIAWRRQANTAETAAQNAINQQNVQNAFSLTAAAQAAMWQELRDQAAFDQQSYENQQDREAQLYASAISNESAAAEGYDQTTHLINLANSFFA